MKKTPLVFTLVLACAAASITTRADEAYLPLDANLWSQELKLKAAGEWTGMLALCRKAYRKSFSTMEGAEGRLICVEALIGAGYPLAASDLTLQLIQKHPGSSPTLFAMSDIERSFHTSHDDTNRWQAAVQTLALAGASPNVVSMVEYFRYLRLVRLKLDDWALKARAKIDPDSYWAARLNFYDAIEDFESGDTDSAESAFQTILKNPSLPPWFAKTVKLQLARVYFEKNDLDKASQLFESYTSDSRDYGRALLDRAWIEFHRKNYSKALGLLTVLKAPFFNDVKDPERYLLAVLIYRKLCHFDDIKNTVKEFAREYKTTLNDIKRESPLHKDDVLMGLTLSYGRLQERGDLVAQLRAEKAAWAKIKGRTPFDQDITRFYLNDEKRVRYDLEFNNRDIIRAQAERILTVRDQLHVIDYIVDLEKLRPQNVFSHQPYKDPEEGKKSLVKLYWPHHKEFWWDEMNDYRVLIDDKCVPERSTAGAEP